MKCERMVDGIPVNPVLPKNFDDTDNDERPASHDKWWNVPFIITNTIEELDSFYANGPEEARKNWEEEGGREAWLEAWPTGNRFDTRCLDGGAWDRSTFWGGFGTIEEAVQCAKEGPAWRKVRS